MSEMPFEVHEVLCDVDPPFRMTADSGGRQILMIWGAQKVLDSPQMYYFQLATMLTSKSTWLPNSAISHSFELGINHQRSPLKCTHALRKGSVAC